MSWVDRSPFNREPHERPIAYFRVDVRPKAGVSPEPTEPSGAPLRQEYRPHPLPREVDDFIADRWKQRQGEFAENLNRAAKVVLGPEARVEVEGRHGTLVI
jgi:hypothetical protein